MYVFTYMCVCVCECVCVVYVCNCQLFQLLIVAFVSQFQVELPTYKKMRVGVDTATGTRTHKLRIYFL